MKNTTTIYEVANNYFGTSHSTLREAKKELKEMSKGYPNNSDMSQESREYWKAQSFKMSIFKKTITTEKIS